MRKGRRLIYLPANSSRVFLGSFDIVAVSYFFIITRKGWELFVLAPSLLLQNSKHVLRIGHL